MADLRVLCDVIGICQRGLQGGLVFCKFFVETVEDVVCITSSLWRMLLNLLSQDP